MVIPSDVARNPAILSLQALELCSTVGQLQLFSWEFFVLRFSVLLSFSCIMISLVVILTVILTPQIGVTMF